MAQTRNTPSTPAPVQTPSDQIYAAVNSVLTAPAYMDNLADALFKRFEAKAAAPVTPVTPAPVAPVVTRDAKIKPTAPSSAPLDPPDNTDDVKVNVTLNGHACQTRGMNCVRKAKTDPHGPFSSGKEGYFVNGKVYINGKWHQMSINLVEIAG